MGQPRLHLPGGHTILLRKTSSKVRVEPIKYRNHPAYAAFSSKQVTAVKPIAKGKTIGFYGGRIVPGDAPWNVYQMRLRKIGRGQWSVDAQEEDEDNAMRYVNDAKGMDLEPNAQFFDDMQHVIEGKYAIPELQALRNIEPGEEILVSYGPEYWKEVEEAYKEANPIVCPECDYRTNVMTKLYMHKAGKHKEKEEYECSTCKKILKSKQGLSDHENAVHTHEQLYSCTDCSYTSYRRVELNKHKVQHNVEPKSLDDFICFHCKRKFISHYEMKRHVKMIHKRDEQPWLSCKECSYKTKEESGFRRHVNSNHRPLMFLCKDCDFRTATNQRLQTHINAMHMPLTFHCESCGFKTATNARLQNHIQGKHLRQWSHCCQECDFGSMYSWDLKRHVEKYHS